MYNTVIKHDGHLRTRGKSKKKTRAAVECFFICISQVCFQMSGSLFGSLDHFRSISHANSEVQVTTIIKALYIFRLVFNPSLINE